MNTYLISYDLSKPESSEGYKRIFEYLKSYGTYAKPLQSLWFIRTTKTVFQVRDELLQYTDHNDHFIVVDVTNKSWGSFNINDKVSDWMTRFIVQNYF